MTDRDVTVDQVEGEHLAEVHVGKHWLYLVGVIVVGLALMLTLIAWLGSSSG